MRASDDDQTSFGRWQSMGPRLDYSLLTEGFVKWPRTGYSWLGSGGED